MQVALGSTSRRTGRDDASASPGAATTAAGRARVGPNTLIQTLGAVRERLGPGWATHLAARAQLPDPLPRDMVDERAFARLVRVLVVEFGAERAEELLAQGGVGTGEYVLRNRIPRVARLLLPRLPRRWALWVLFRAVRAHAWTFAGSARFASRTIPGGAEFTLAPSLVCATADAGRFMGSYYARAVEVLVRALVAPRARVRELDCVSTGGSCCRFGVDLDPDASPAPFDPPTEDSCASS